MLRTTPTVRGTPQLPRAPRNPDVLLPTSLSLLSLSLFSTTAAHDGVHVVFLPVDLDLWSALAMRGGIEGVDSGEASAQATEALSILWTQGAMLARNVRTVRQPFHPPDNGATRRG
jgi:hypothetical protein